jgi:hypothetical protein
MNALNLLKKALIEMGADGLCCPGEECGCGLDDLAPCDCLNLRECEAAKWIPAMKCDPEELEKYPAGYFKVI